MAVRRTRPVGIGLAWSGIVVVGDPFNFISISSYDVHFDICYRP
jgi:hypothetical protein